MILSFSQKRTPLFFAMPIFDRIVYIYIYKYKSNKATYVYIVMNEKEEKKIDKKIYVSEKKINQWNEQQERAMMMMIPDLDYNHDPHIIFHASIHLKTN